MITKIKESFASLLAIWNRFRTARSGYAVFWYGGSSLICQALRFGVLLWALKFIETGIWDDWARFQLIFGLSMVLTNLGQDEGLVAVKQGDTHLYGFQLLSKLIGGLLAFPLSYVLFRYFDWTDSRIQEFWWLVPLTAMIFAVNSVATIHTQRAFRFKLVAIANILSLVAHCLALWALASRVTDYRLFVAAQWAELGTFLLLTGFCIPWKSLSTALNAQSIDY